MHKTFMRLDFKPVAQLQRRLNHVMKEVVMKVVFYESSRLYMERIKPYHDKKI